MRPGTLVIDSSTIDPLITRELHNEALLRSIQMLDAPVRYIFSNFIPKENKCYISGGITGASAGTLTFMVGGGDGTLSRARVSIIFDLIVSF